MRLYFGLEVSHGALVETREGNVNAGACTQGVTN